MLLTALTDNLYAALLGTSLTEWLIFVTALLYVILAAKNNSWCWAFGIISSALSIYLCITGKLFLESGLQVFYVAIGFYGWYEWKFGAAEKKELPVRHIPAKLNLLVLFLGILLWIPLAITAASFSTQALPYLDACITAFSLVATWMTAKRYLENWIYWMIIDALAIFLYASRGFYLIALIYIIYTFLAVAGYYAWKRLVK